MIKTTFGLWIPLLILIITFMLNVYKSESLYIFGQSLIFWAQKYQSPVINAFFIFFTFLIEPYFVVSFLFIALSLFKKKFEGIVMSIAILFNIYFFLIMKAYLTEPRPFWTSSSIKCIGYYCPKDYGSPSGHTEFAVFIFMIFLVHFNTNRKLWPIIVSFVTVILVMMSRMFLGGHSLDQVLFGFIVAASVVVIYEIGGIKLKISQYLLKYNNRKFQVRVLIFILTCHLLALLVFVLNTNRDSSFHNQFNEWSKNFKAKCSFSINADFLNQSSLLSQSIILSFILGYFYAFKSIRKESQGLNYLKGKWKFNNKKYLFLAKPYYVLLGLILLTLPIIVTFPLVLLFSRTFLIKYVMFNLGLLVAPYFYLNFGFKLSKLFELIEIDEETTKELTNLKDGIKKE